MDFFSSYAFLTIVSVVGSAIGIVLALRADIGKRIDRVEEGLGRRIDRVEDRARADHRELVAEIGKVKTAVSVLATKLDERSAPRRLLVQEPAGAYAVGDEPEGSQENS